MVEVESGVEPSAFQYVLSYVSTVNTQHPLALYDVLYFHYTLLALSGRAVCCHRISGHLESNQHGRIAAVTEI